MCVCNMVQQPWILRETNKKLVWENKSLEMIWSMNKFLQTLSFFSRRCYYYEAVTWWLACFMNIFTTTHKEPPNKWTGWLKKSTRSENLLCYVFYTSRIYANNCPHACCNLGNSKNLLMPSGINHLDIQYRFNFTSLVKTFA